MCPSGLGLLRVCLLSFTFPFVSLFFSPACVKSSCTIHALGFTVQERKSIVHRTYKHFFQKKKYILKMGPKAWFTYLKIILLQCFLFSVFKKISCIWTNPTYSKNLTIDYMFSIFLTHISNFVIFGYYLLYDAQIYF